MSVAEGEPPCGLQAYNVGEGGSVAYVVLGVDLVEGLEVAGLGQQRLRSLADDSLALLGRLHARSFSFPKRFVVRSSLSPASPSYSTTVLQTLQKALRKIQHEESLKKRLADGLPRTLGTKFAEGIRPLRTSASN